MCEYFKFILKQFALLKLSLTDTEKQYEGYSKSS